jgi:hypothetical protein
MKSRQQPKSRSGGQLKRPEMALSRGIWRMASSTRASSTLGVALPPAAFAISSMARTISSLMAHRNSIADAT